MLKKTLFLLVAVAWFAVGSSSAVLATDHITNATQKGSLLIFPKIDISEGRDTIVQISNDFYRTVHVKCYWVDAQQNIQDFQFPLTPNQPVWLRASDGRGTGYYDDVSNPITAPPFTGPVGELKCWAVSANGREQISWNHLYGNAIIYSFVDGSAYEYNSWGFQTRGIALGSKVGTGGTMILSGRDKAYDACPKYLLANFFANQRLEANGRQQPIDLSNGSAFFYVNKTDLTIVPCIQDLRQDRIPTCTKIKFDIWNENETKYTGAYQCIKCWYEGYLDRIGQTAGGYGGEKFTWPYLHTTVGRFRAEGIPSTVCNGVYPQCREQIKSPLLGVIATEIGLGTTGGLNATFGTNLHSAGDGIPSTILWDPEDEVVFIPER
jgi:hypothetical protein